MMATKLMIAGFLGLMMMARPAWTAEEKAPTSETSAPVNVKYRAGKDVSFDELLINGQLKRPEIMVVTGNADQGTNGLLRLRENFIDRVASDYSEEESAQ